MMGLKQIILSSKAHHIINLEKLVSLPIFHGLYQEDVKYLFDCVTKGDLSSNNDEQIINHLNDLKVCFFESI